MPGELFFQTLCFWINLFDAVLWKVFQSSLFQNTFFKTLFQKILIDYLYNFELAVTWDLQIKTFYNLNFVLEFRVKGSKGSEFFW